MNKNKLYTIITYALYTVASLSASGTLIQTLLSEIGFSSGEIYIHSSVVQAVTMISVLLFSRWADGSNVMKKAALSTFFGGVLFFAYLPLCLTEDSGKIFPLLIAVSVLQSFILALYTICDYKLPYYLFSPHEYGAVLAICGIISSIVTFVVGIVVSALSKFFAYTDIMLAVFIISGVFLIIAALLRSMLKPIIDLASLEENRVKVPLSRTLSHGAFRQLFLPHLLRGYSFGATCVLAVTATELGYSASATTATVPVMAISIVISSTVFGLFSAKASYSRLIVIGSLFFLALPLMLIGNSPVVFLIAYGLVIFGRNFIDNAVPAALIYVVPSEIAGPYNALRLAIHFSGIVLSNLLAAKISVGALLFSALAVQLLSAILFATAPAMKAASPKNLV